MAGIFGSIGARRITDDSSADFLGRGARESMREIIRNYIKLIDQIEAATPDVIYKAVEPTFKKSQDYCPVKTSALKKSGYIEKTSFRGKPRVEVGYARGGKPNYAIYVHEMTGYNHRSPTRAKFLQVALEEDLPKFHGRLVQSYRGLIGG